MHKILFICHGNICRSPMAEFVMKDLVKKAGRENEFYIESSATSSEEIGSDIHSGTRRMLDKNCVPYKPRKARRITIEDYDKYDLLICMDDENIYNMSRIFTKDNHQKIHKLLEWIGTNRDVADPWYTGNFEKTWDDIYKGCTSLLKSLR